MDVWSESSPRDLLGDRKAARESSARQLVIMLAGGLRVVKSLERAGQRQLMSKPSGRRWRKEQLGKAQDYHALHNAGREPEGPMDVSQVLRQGSPFAACPAPPGTKVPLTAPCSDEGKSVGAAGTHSPVVRVAGYKASSFISGKGLSLRSAGNSWLCRQPLRRGKRDIGQRMDETALTSQAPLAKLWLPWPWFCPSTGNLLAEPAVFPRKAWE